MAFAPAQGGELSDAFTYRQIVSVQEMEAVRQALLYLKGREIAPDNEIRLEAPLQYVHLTTAQRDALNTPTGGSTIWNTDTRQVETWVPAEDPVAAGVLGHWVSGGVAEHEHDSFNLHLDVTSRRTSLHNTDRFLVSDEETGRLARLLDPTAGTPNSYISWAEFQRQLAAVVSSFNVWRDVGTPAFPDGPRPSCVR